MTINIESEVKPNRVVVIGSRGFVGKHFCATLDDKGISYKALSSSDIDLTREDAVEKLKAELTANDHVVFISALTPDKGRDVKTMMANLRMCENVCLALEEQPSAHLTYISSDAVYSDDENPVRESSSCDPSSFHGIMHITREKMLLEVTSRKEIPFMRLRPCAIFGPGDTHGSYGPNRFVAHAFDSGEITLGGAGEEERDHIYIDDVCDLILKCVTTSATGVLNLSTGSAVTFHKVAETVQAGMARLDRQIEIKCTPRKTPITYKHFDVTELVKAFPSFEFTSLSEGIAKVVRR